MLLDQRGNDQATDRRRQLRTEGKLRGEWAAVIEAEQDEHFDPKLTFELAYVLVLELQNPFQVGQLGLDQLSATKCRSLGFPPPPIVVWGRGPGRAGVAPRVGEQTMIIRLRIAVSECDISPQLFQLCDQDGVGHIHPIPAGHEVGAWTSLKGWSLQWQRLRWGDNKGLEVREVGVL